jgi:hypothetical protein
MDFARLMGIRASSDKCISFPLFVIQLTMYLYEGKLADMTGKDVARLSCAMDGNMFKSNAQIIWDQMMHGLETHSQNFTVEQLLKRLGRPSTKETYKYVAKYDSGNDLIDAVNQTTNPTLNTTNIETLKKIKAQIGANPSAALYKTTPNDLDDLIAKANTYNDAELVAVHHNNAAALGWNAAKQTESTVLYMHKVANDEDGNRQNAGSTIMGLKPGDRILIESTTNTQLWLVTGKPKPHPDSTYSNVIDVPVEHVTVPRPLKNVVATVRGRNAFTDDESITVTLEHFTPPEEVYSGTGTSATPAPAPAPDPVIQTFTIGPSNNVTQNDPIILNQTFTGGTGVITKGLSKNLKVVSGRPVQCIAKSSGTFELTVTNAVGTKVKKETQLTVAPYPEIQSFFIHPSNVEPNKNVTLYQEFTGGTGVITQKGYSSKTKVFSKQPVVFTVRSSGTFVLTVTNTAGTEVKRQIQLTVTAASPAAAPAPAPAASLTAPVPPVLPPPVPPGLGLAPVPPGLGSRPSAPPSAVTIVAPGPAPAASLIAPVPPTLVSTDTITVGDIFTLIPTYTGKATLMVTYNGKSKMLNLYGSNNPVEVTFPHTGKAVFTLTDTVDTECKKFCRNKTASRTVDVVPKPDIHSFTITPDNVQPGTQVTLTANFSGGKGYITKGFQNITQVQNGIQVPFDAMHSDTFTLAVINAAGKLDTTDTTLTVIPLRPAPLRPAPLRPASLIIVQPVNPQITQFKSNRKQILPGEEVELTIQYTDGTATLTANTVNPVMQSPFLSPGKNVITEKPNVTTTYILTVVNNTGKSNQKSITVKVCDMEFQFPSEVTQINQNTWHVYNVYKQPNSFTFNVKTSCDGTLTISSSNPKVATANGMTIQTVNPGRTEITVTKGEITRSFTLVVEDEPQITFNDITKTVGEKFMLKVSPNTQYKIISNSDARVASYDDKSEFTAHSPGTTQITIVLYDQYNKFQKQLTNTITVEPKPVVVVGPVPSLTDSLGPAPAPAPSPPLRPSSLASSSLIAPPSSPIASPRSVLVVEPSLDCSRQPQLPPNPFIQSFIQRGGSRDDIPEDSTDKSSIQVPPSLALIQIPDNGWSFFQALLGITYDPINPDILKQIRELASAITWCAADATDKKNTNNIKILINKSRETREKKTINLNEYIKLISIPNGLEPCVYLLGRTTIHELIGKYAAHIMGKHIIVVTGDDENYTVDENYGDPAMPKIYLKYTSDTDGAHYDVLEPPQFTCTQSQLPSNPFIEDFIQRGGKGPFNANVLNTYPPPPRNVNVPTNWRFYQDLLPVAVHIRLCRQLASAITWRTLNTNDYKPGLNRNISTTVNGTPMTITGTQFVKLMSVGFSEPCVLIDKDTLPLIGQAAADIIGKNIHMNGTNLPYGNYPDTLVLESSSLSSGSTYTVTVVTGSVPGSGTNSNVFITLIGQNGESNQVQLYAGNAIQPAHHYLFETSNTDTFNVVSNINIGELHKIRVRIDGSGWGHTWLLDHIIVSGGGLANPVRFDSKIWMSDDQPSVELFPIPKLPKRIGEAETPSAKA